MFKNAILIGNEFNKKTYDAYSFEKFYLVPNTGYDFKPPIVFSSKKNPKSFLYFGSYGAVHKGLDLLLDIFSQKDFPCKLYVCGLYYEEKDFVDAYKRELYNTDNIIPVGFVDVSSSIFRDLCEECCYTILPSCSEGMAGSITTCMSAGVVPICSRQCGFDKEDVILLENCDKESIENTILKYSQVNLDEICLMSKTSISIIGNKYSLLNFYDKMKFALAEIISCK